MNKNQNLNENLNPSEIKTTSGSRESMPEINKKFNIYDKVIDLIIEQLKKGHIAWENPVFCFQFKDICKRRTDRRTRSKFSNG